MRMGCPDFSLSARRQPDRRRADRGTTGVWQSRGGGGARETGFHGVGTTFAQRPGFMYIPARPFGRPPPRLFFGPDEFGRKTQRAAAGGHGFTATDPPRRSRAARWFAFSMTNMRGN